VQWVITLIHNIMYLKWSSLILRLPCYDISENNCNLLLALCWLMVICLHTHIAVVCVRVIWFAGYPFTYFVLFVQSAWIECIMVILKVCLILVFVLHEAQMNSNFLKTGLSYQNLACDIKCRSYQDQILFKRLCNVVNI